MRCDAPSQGKPTRCFSRQHTPAKRFNREAIILAKPNPLVKSFKSFFQDNDDYFKHPGNVGTGRTVASICKQVLEKPDPILFETLNEWDSRGKLKTRYDEKVSVLDISRALRALGQLEGAWAVAQLHYDQLLKQEAKVGKRLHKGHPACGLALLANELGTPLLSRHFALLSSAGDIAWEHEVPELSDGGLGPTLLERHESTARQQAWRDSVRTALVEYAKTDDKPVYLEAFVAGQWFESHADHIYKFVAVKEHAGKPFTEVLLDTVESNEEHNYTTVGTVFEAVTGLLLASTPGFEVDSARKTADEQIDLVVHYVPDDLCDLGLEPGFGLVECKSSAKRIGVAELRDFGSKCLFHRVRFGILVARAGVTNGVAEFQEPANAELVRRRFQVDGLTLLVLDISHLKNKSYELRGLQDDLRADYRRLVFGEKP